MMLLLVATVLVSGCAQQPATPSQSASQAPTQVNSDKDVAKVVGDVSTDVSQLSKDLADIDKGLG